jgi:phosphatidate cytidylyltransferase
VALPNLAQRLISAVVALPLVAALILWHEPWGFGALMLIVAAIGLREYGAIALAGARPRLRVGVILLGVGLAAGLYALPAYAVVWTLAAFVGTAALVLFDPGDITAAGARLGIAAFGVFYLGLLCAPMAILQRDAPHGRAWVMLAIALTFSNDTGAYFAGRGFGRRKLYPRISPSKTWEGFLGGLVASVAGALIVKAFLLPAVSWGAAAIVGAGCGVLGPLGDLSESMLKRAFDKKDSSHILPGHGGLLDRIDALLFNAPFVWLCARLLQQPW